MYSYTTPEEAIKSLETAYTNNDLAAIINSKDFICEAKFILESAAIEYDLDDDEIVLETAKLAELSLILSLQKNGYPDFTDLKSEIYDLQRFRENIYFVNERISYPDGFVYVTRIFLTLKNDVWKVALIEE